MKIGVFGPALYDRTFEEALDTASKHGLEAVEIACGNYVGDKHCNSRALLRDPSKLKRFGRVIKDRGLIISALSCHGNPLHPSRKIASSHAAVQRNAILLAEKLEVERIVLLAGCPGDSGGCKYPNWAIPGISGLGYEEELADWQWKEKVIPFWQNEANFAERHGVGKLCFELHAGDVLFNPRTFLNFRKKIGKVAGVNFDPSHLFWQGIDAPSAVVALRGAIYHVHGKDTYLASDNVKVNGVLDANVNSDLSERSWYFRSAGYGHDVLTWKSIVSNLRLFGYDYVISIEHEDAMMSREEGLRRSIEFFKGVVIKERAEPPWWV